MFWIAKKTNGDKLGSTLNGTNNATSRKTMPNILIAPNLQTTTHKKNSPKKRETQYAF